LAIVTSDLAMGLVPALPKDWMPGRNRDATSQEFVAQNSK